mgnify:CR=1 FL=1
MCERASEGVQDAQRQAWAREKVSCPIRSAQLLLTTPSLPLPLPLFLYLRLHPHTYTPDANGFFAGQTGYGYISIAACIKVAAGQQQRQEHLIL